MDIAPDQAHALEIFFPFAEEKQANALRNGTRFVHYTTAESAMRILQSNEIWMRKTSCMNDYMEVVHGLDCLGSAYRGEDGQGFKTALNNVFDGISDDIEKLFNAWAPHLETDTYLACISEHDDSEDSIGRLSMWRAYGQSTGVALVINNGPLLRPSDALKVYTSPVAYLDDKAVGLQLRAIAEAINENADFVRSQGREAIQSYVFEAFKFAALCTKHPGFKEEREWRLVYSPALAKSDRIVKEIQVVSGAPQPICKIPLRNFPDEGFFGAEVPELLDRIIIGPTQFGVAMYEAFKDLLGGVGVKDPGSRISISSIPLR